MNAANRLRTLLKDMGYTAYDLTNHQLWTHPEIEVTVLLPHGTKMSLRYEKECIKRIKRAKVSCNTMTSPVVYN